MLSASDAGRIGRLVLPKKCAEVSGHTFLAVLLIFSPLIFFSINVVKLETILVYWFLL